MNIPTNRRTQPARAWVLLEALINGSHDVLAVLRNDGTHEVIVDNDRSFVHKSLKEAMRLAHEAIIENKERECK